ncbi:MAG: glycogen debranching N-terminal domain-containing protein, partial [Terriglobales bacterium]
MSVTDTTAATKRRREQKPYKAINPDYPRLAIKHDTEFLLTDTEGLMPGKVEQGLGFFGNDTRWLSQWQLALNGKPLFLLNGTTRDGYAANFVYSNAELPGLPKQSVMVERDVVINDGMTERLVVRNYADHAIEVSLRINFGSDFADMFEVRGQQRQRRGQLMPPVVASDRRRVTLAYEGLDGIRRETYIDMLKMRPQRLTGRCATFRLKLGRHEARELLFHVSTQSGKVVSARPRPSVTYEQQRAIADARYRGWREYSARITTGNPRFNAVLEQAELDLYVLVQGSERGRALAAGVPWFAVPFGRDDLIAALQTVSFKPELS